MKKILIGLLIIGCILFVYNKTKSKKTTYLNISDIENPYSEIIKNELKKENKLEKFENSLSSSDIRITDLIKKIEVNEPLKGKTITVNNMLIKSKIITLSIGNTDFYFKLNKYDANEMYNYIDQILKDYDNLFFKMRKITKENIIVFSYGISSLDKEQIINYFNNHLEELCIEYKIEFIRVDEVTRTGLKNRISALLKN